MGKKNNVTKKVINKIAKKVNVDKVKGSKTLTVFSIVMIITSIFSIIFGYYIVSNIVSLIIWILALICCIKGW